MSAGIRASGGGEVSSSSNFFLDLPDEVFEIVLGYMAPVEGARLMQINNRTLKERLVEVLIENQEKYFSTLCNQISRYFVFDLEKYRQKMGRIGEKIKKFKKNAREVPCTNFMSLTLDELNKRSEYLGKEIFPYAGEEFAKHLTLFFRGLGRGAAFFTPAQERVPEALVALGIERASRYKLTRDVIKLAEKEEENKPEQQLYIEIALSIRGSFEGLKRILLCGQELDASMEQSIPGERAFRLLGRIENKKTKERLMNMWVEGVNRRDPFLRTEEFVSELSPVALVRYLVRTGERGNRVLSLFDKTIRESNELVKKEVLFRFFHYWCEYGHAFHPAEPFFMGEFQAKFNALIGTLPEAETNSGIFRILKSMISSQRLFVGERNCDDYLKLSLPYLEYEVDEKGLPPLHIIEALPQIVKQIEEHKCFNQSYRLFTYYFGCCFSLPLFFQSAMQRVRQESEVTLILDSVLQQIEGDCTFVAASRFQEIFYANTRYPPNIQAIINDRKEKEEHRFTEGLWMIKRLKSGGKS